MRIAIHQSQYLPWPPYFRVIALADLFVLMDAVQYQKNGLQNRNRIRNHDKAFWLTVPVSGKLSDEIRDKPVADDLWRRKHWNSIVASYRGAPHWDRCAEGLAPIYESPAATLGDVNDRVLGYFLALLGISTPVKKMSALQPEGKKSELVLSLCAKAGADVYLSGTGGKEYLDENAFERGGVAIQYLASSAPEYPQFHGDPFIPGLSMLDMVMNVGAERLREYLLAPAA